MSGIVDDGAGGLVTQQRQYEYALSQVGTRPDMTMDVAAAR